MEYSARAYLQSLREMAPDATRITDKTPGNFMYLGLIELMLPGARIIHCRRNPLDSCLSCYFQDFFQDLPWSYDMENLATYYRGYEQMMTHWSRTLRIPVLNVTYEDLVANQEETSRMLIEFCGLPWDERCLQFHTIKRFVATASYDQVRRPVYSRSVGRWKNYQSQIAPLIKNLADYRAGN